MSQRRPLAQLSPPDLRGGRRRRRPARRRPPWFPYTGWHRCHLDSGSFSPPTGEGGESQVLQLAPGRSPARAGPRRCTSVGRQSSTFHTNPMVEVGLYHLREFQRRDGGGLPGDPQAPLSDLGLLLGLQGRWSAP